jgi:hypothetical protein
MAFPDLFRKQMDRVTNTNWKFGFEGESGFFKSPFSQEISSTRPQMTGKASPRTTVILFPSFLKYISLCCYHTVSCHINNTELTNRSGKSYEIHYWLPSPPKTNGGRAVRRHSSANILDVSHNHHPSLMSLVATQSDWAIMKLTKLVLIKRVQIQTNDI